MTGPDDLAAGRRAYLSENEADAAFAAALGRHEAREAAWAIVKDSRGMQETGHGATVRWARAYLELDARKDRG